MKWLSFILIFTSPALYAHTGGIVEHSLLSGLLHPLTGIDHLLALMAVGLCAAKQGGRAVYGFPLLFLMFMSVGALLSIYTVPLPFVETAIAVSMLLFGLLVHVQHQQRAAISITCIAGFALFHGYAHAAEVPYGASFNWYFIALLLMSLGICLGSSVLGRLIGNRGRLTFTLTCVCSSFYYLAVN